MLYTWARQLHFKEYSIAVFISLPWACKTSNSIITYWKGSNKRDSGAGDCGWFFCDTENFCQRLSSRHDRKASGQTSPLCGLPFLLPRWLWVCFHILTPNANFPSGNLQPESCQLSRARTWVHGEELFLFSWLHKYEALEENNLKPFENGNSLPFLLPEASCRKSGHDSLSQELLLSPKEKLNWNCRIWRSFLQNLKGHVLFFVFFFFFLPKRR